MTDHRHTAVTCDGMPGRRNRMLAGYLLNRRRGASTVRKMIRDDIKRFNDLGARHYASDLIQVLDAYEAKFPEAVEDKAQ